MRVVHRSAFVISRLRRKQFTVSLFVDSQAEGCKAIFTAAGLVSMDNDANIRYRVITGVTSTRGDPPFLKLIHA